MHEVWAVVLLFLGVLFEGEIVLIFTGILIHVGVLPPKETILFVALAAFLKTLLGYALGNWIAHNWPQSSILKYVEKKILLLLPRFRERPFWSIFISKFIYGVNHVTMIFAGYMKANFKVYIRAEIVSTILWLAGFMGLGYFFSTLAFSISHDLRKVTLLIVVFIGMFILLQKLISFIYDLVELSPKE